MLEGNELMNKNAGMPIYPEPDKRMADSLAEIDVDAWYPSNSVSNKLWRCVESLRDLDLILSELPSLKNATKRKRVLKIAVTPLHALALSIDDLLNDMLCNKETSSNLSSKDRNEIKDLKKLFDSLLPHDRKSVFSGVRNKLSAHVDKKLHPYSAQKLSQNLSSDEFGRWLSICIHLLLDLTKLDIYTWSCKAPLDKYLRFMTDEPFVVTIWPDSPKGCQLVAMNVAKTSPRDEVSELVELLIKHSKWLFSRSGHPPFKGLVPTPDEHWNTFKDTHEIHKVSNII